MPTKHDKTWFETQENRALFRSEIARRARLEIGYKERPGNDTKYGQALKYNGTAWCAVFVSWVYVTVSAQLSVPNPLAGLTTKFGFAHCTTSFARAKRRGLVLVPGESPMPGDVVVYDHDAFPFGDGHTGIVVATFKNGRYDTVEGNTDQAFSRSGGAVGKHEHLPGDGKHGVLLGFIRPTRAFS